MASFAEFTAAPASLTTWTRQVPTDLGRAAELELLRDKRTELEEELAEIDAAEAAAKEAGTARRRKASEGVNPRITEIKAALTDLEPKIADLEKLLEASAAMVTLRVIDTGEWLLFAETHPAAEEGEPGYDYDLAIGRDAVSVRAMTEHLGRFVVGWNDEKIPLGAWTVDHTNKIPPADVLSMIQSIVDHHHRALILPKSSSVSSPIGTSATS